MNEMQMDLFDVLYDDFKFKEPLKTITLFSGIGFQEMGMELAEIPYEMIGTSEIDKFAILSYAAIHTDYLEIRGTYSFPDKEIMVKHLQDRNIGINLKTHKQTITNSTNIETVKDYYLASVLNKNLGDISKIKGKDIQQGIDLLTYSFPCTDLSKAGQQAGLSCGTRSGLVYEVLRILYELKEQDNLPKVLIMENVIDLIQVKFVDEWNKIALEIEQMGYTNFTQVLNGKDYGVAQNRRRVFMVSILGDYNYNFPQPTELKYRLKDYLESDVDEKYYLSDKMMDYLNSDHPKHKRKHKFKKNQKPMNYKGVANTITTRETSVVDSTFIKVPEATKQGYALAKDGDGIYINRPHQKRGVVQDGMIQTIKTGANDVGVVVRDEPVIMDSAYPGSREPRIYKDTAPTLTTKSGSLEVIEPNAKRQLTNAMLESGNFKPYDMVRHSYTNNRMEDLDRKEGENNISATLTTRSDTLGVVVGSYDYGSSDSFMKGKSRLQENPKLSNTIITSPNIGLAIKEKNNLRIRKLTPTETGRLMGMQDFQIERQEKVSSNAQAYKQHGNGIIAQVMAFIIGMMWYEDENELRQTILENSFTWKKENKNGNK